MHSYVKACAVLLLLSGSVTAEPPLRGPLEEDSIDWRQANDAVGRFTRGHIDVLKWEQTQQEPASAPEPQATPESAPEPSGAALDLPTAEAAVHLAWQAHPDLDIPLIRLGKANVTRIAQGNWQEVDPALISRTEHATEILELAHAARKAWLGAVAAQQRLQVQRDSLNATEAAAELARRMAKVGNWSRLQQAREQNALTDAQIGLLRSEYEVTMGQAELQHVLKVPEYHPGLNLPDQLPALPDQALPHAYWQARLEELLNVKPRGSQQRIRTRTLLAVTAYNTSHAIARRYQDDTLALQQFMVDEAVLRYNGMLISVWDLLAERRNQTLAIRDAISAQRDFWLAEADLQWVLQGGAPTQFISLGDGTMPAEPSAGH